MPTPTPAETPRALLVSIRTPEISLRDAEDSLRELERLVATLGFRVVGTEFQNRPSTTSATAVGSGKLKELARRTGGTGERIAEESDSEEEPEETQSAFGNPLEGTQELATVVVFDCDLRPSQFRHLENALGCEVLDRTGVIIEIFSRHARSRTARLEVEIARLNYLSPRIREVGSSGERQSGRGSGESALATERRAIRDRLAELKRELAARQGTQADRRSLRSDQPSVALVGYTNAGKSSTMRALTGSDLLVADKLFATLDTTVRALQPETVPRILVSDTVGFIKKLPHDLVASFRSTLDEALNASLLLILADASDPTFRSQLEVVEDALLAVGALSTPKLLLLNKADLLTPEERARLQREFPAAVLASVRTPEDVKKLHGRLVEHFEREMKEEELFVPYEKSACLGELRAQLRIVGEAHGETGTCFTVRSRPEALERFKEKFGL